ncbi:MAG: biotin--[acetyl-CoA-carboxylase] ligase [Clostridiales bacterium]|jgi:BirA family biotin operon repressor/biotin-[acetyl-CoA-carboxylase] ligase|nr:biotin--[acetyl-CoA-carboxylase] ligase [Clostridiales bacterium]
MHTVYITKNPKRRFNVYLFGKLPSTNDEIKKAVYNPFDAVIANNQSDGKGRNGRPFVSNEGGLYMSVLLDGDAPFAEYITPLAGAAAASVLEEFGFDAGIKWVNDIFVGGGKICGILAEKFSRGEKNYIALGIGLNVNNKNFGEFADIATSMFLQTNSRYRLSEVAGRVLETLNFFLAAGKKKTIDVFREKSIVLGKKIVLSDGGDRVTAVGIDGDGGLIVEDGKGNRRVITAGSIRVED